MRREFVKRTDLAVILALLCVGAAVWGAMGSSAEAPGGLYAEVLVDGVVAERLPLDVDRVYTPAGREWIRLEVRGGSCGFLHSDCPDQICVRAGFLSRPGQGAACLPNRTVMRIVSGTDAEQGQMDAVAG